MRLLLVALLSTAPVFCSAQGVVYIDDIESLPKSALQSPNLPGSLAERSAVPQAPNRYAVPTGQEIQLTAAHTYSQSRNQTAKNKPQEAQKNAKKSSFFSKMKPTWLFGDGSKDEAPKDPFLAHSPSNKEVFRNRVDPIATYDASNQAPVTNAAYSNSKFTRPSFGLTKAAPAQPSTQAKASNTQNKSNLKSSQSIPRQSGGIAMRRESKPKGLLNHLGWMNGEDEPSKPAPTKPLITKQAKQPKPQSRKSLPRPEQTQVLAQGPAPVFVESKQTVTKADQSSSKRLLSANSHSVKGFGSKEPVAEEALLSTDSTYAEKVVVSIPETTNNVLADNILEIVEEEKLIEQPEGEAIFASDEMTPGSSETEEPQDDEATFVESNETTIAQSDVAESSASKLSAEKVDPLAILEREIVQPALAPQPMAKATPTKAKAQEDIVLDDTVVEDLAAETPAMEIPIAETPVAATPIVEAPLPTPTIEARPAQLPTIQAQRVESTVQQVKAAEPLPIPSSDYIPKPIVTQTAPSVAPTQNPFVESRAIVDPNKEPTERSRILLSEAHGLAQDAENIEQYTAIVQRCRYVLAIDDAPIAVDYANELASWALNKRGEDLLDQGRNAEATVDFNDAIRCNSDCWRAIHNLGVLQAQSGDYESAAKHFNKALALNPEYAKAYANRAALHVQSANYQQALQDYQRAIQIDPDLAMAHSGRGRVCHMLGYLEQALRHLDAAQLLTPSDATICLGRGDLLVDLGRYGQARQAYQQAIELEPKSANAYRNLAWMQATCPSNTFRNGEEALANAIRASELAGTPDDITLDTHAAALATLGRFDEAVGMIKMAIEIAPASDVSAYTERLQMYLRKEAFLSQPFGMVQSASFEGQPAETSTR